MDIRGIDRQLGKISDDVLQVNTLNEGETADALIDQSKRRNANCPCPGGRSPGEFHPEALTDPCVNLSIHTALHSRSLLSFESKPSRGKGLMPEHPVSQPSVELCSPMWSREVARWFRSGLSVSGPFVCRCLTSPAMLRFHIPLIEPDRRN